MEQEIHVKRFKKSDKAKNNYAKTGGITQKYIRQQEYKKSRSNKNKNPNKK